MSMTAPRAFEALTETSYHTASLYKSIKLDYRDTFELQAYSAASTRFPQITETYRSK